MNEKIAGWNVAKQPTLARLGPFRLPARLLAA